MKYLPTVLISVTPDRSKNELLAGTIFKSLCIEHMIYSLFEATDMCMLHCEYCALGCRFVNIGTVDSVGNGEI